MQTDPKEKRRFPALLQSPPTDSNRRPPPYHGGFARRPRNLGRRFTWRFPCNRRVRGPGDFVLGPQGVPHAYVVRSDQAEFLATFAPASMDRFFEELGGVPVAPGEPAPAASYPDPEEFARGAAKWGVEIVGPPPTLE